MKEVRERLVAALPTIAVVVVFLVYVKTLLPGVGYSGDTSKFQFVGKVLGTPHEPGSPTYVLLNYVFVTLFPLGTTGFKANLLSAIFSALTLLVALRSMLLLGVRHWIAAVVVATFGFTYTLWSQSVIAEVYTLSLLFVALTLHFFLKWHFQGRSRDFLFACAFYSLSFGVHLIVVTLLPAIVYIVLVTRREYFWNPRVILQVFGLIVIGAAQYGYLFWRYYSSDTTYLEIAVPDLKTLWFYVSGGQFHSYFFVGGLRGFFFIGGPIVGRLLWLEYLFLFPVSILGFVLLRNSRVRIFLLLFALGTLLFTILYAIADIFIYLLPVYLVLAVALAVGVEWLFAKCPPRFALPLVCLVLCLPLFFFITNYAKADQSRNTQAKTVVEESLHIVGKNALIICPDYDYAEHFWYYLFAERDQSDSLYALFSHEEYLPLHDLKLYLTEGRPFYLPLQRGNLPAGLTVYYTTAYQPHAFDKRRTRYPRTWDLFDEYRRSFVYQPMRQLSSNGFRFIPVSETLYRIEKPE